MKFINYYNKYLLISTNFFLSQLVSQLKLLWPLTEKVNKEYSKEYKSPRIGVLTRRRNVLSFETTKAETSNLSLRLSNDLLLLIQTNISTCFFPFTTTITFNTLRITHKNMQHRVSVHVNHNKMIYVYVCLLIYLDYPKLIIYLYLEVILRTLIINYQLSRRTSFNIIRFPKSILVDY